VLDAAGGGALATGSTIGDTGSLEVSRGGAGGKEGSGVVTT
jgi:hypothetical protein